MFATLMLTIYTNSNAASNYHSSLCLRPHTVSVYKSKPEYPARRTDHAPVSSVHASKHERRFSHTNKFYPPVRFRSGMNDSISIRAVTVGMGTRRRCRIQFYLRELGAGVQMSRAPKALTARSEIGCMALICRFQF